MADYLHFYMENGDEWRVPIDGILNDAAKHYAEIDGVSFIKSLGETYEHFTSEPSELWDWFLNNMEPSDYMKEHGELVSKSEYQFKIDMCGDYWLD